MENVGCKVVNRCCRYNDPYINMGGGRMLGGIDIGTTGCKITVYTDEGDYCYRSYQDYPVSRTMGAVSYTHLTLPTNSLV